jgi:7-cyano-7-deazaguanine synthase in queuosine biosynthesis
MSAHSVVCRLGAGDTGKVSLVRKGSTVTDVQFVSGAKRLDFGLGQAMDHLSKLGFRPSEIAVDLAITAALMTAADTRINRDAETVDGWTREIDLYVPVSDPTKWTANAGLLERMMNFLTGDRWKLYFRPRPKDFAQIAAAPARLPVHQPNCVCLFSGGLDSFIGAVDLLASGQSPLLVSHYWDGITSDHQTYCAEGLANEYTQPLLHVRARVGFPAALVGAGQIENSLRGRSFMFFALAALAASSLRKVTTIFVPENGLISLNVPLDPLRIGALSTRTTHPYYMARWNELLLALGIDAVLENPYRHMTKGEMAKGCKNQVFLKKFAKDTMSCSSPAKIRWKGEKPMHCGHCVPCLIRRAALHAGFGSDSTEYYLKKLDAQILNSKKAEGEHVRAFQRAIARLKAKPNSARFVIHQPGPLSDYPNDWQKYEAVYVNGMKEVEKLLAGVVTKPL